MAYKYPFGTADDVLKRAVFSRGTIIDDFDANIWRRDVTGHAMKYDDHGVQGDFGWEIDHIKPLALNGSNNLSNLRPLWWQNNRTKGDTYP
jgi:5-methylcytosine-specific restriction endonuclease McrA